MLVVQVTESIFNLQSLLLSLGFRCGSGKG